MGVLLTTKQLFYSVHYFNYFNFIDLIKEEKQTAYLYIS